MVSDTEDNVASEYLVSRELSKFRHFSAKFPWKFSAKIPLKNSPKFSGEVTAAPFLIQIKRKLKQKWNQKRKRGNLREGREAPPRRCLPPLRFWFRFRFDLRLIRITTKVSFRFKFRFA